MPHSPDTTTLHRRFITVKGAFGTRQVHYRRGGRGPVVLLLHQSPQSSREMEPLIEAWGHAFTLISPDTPGYGFSGPLQRDGQPVATASIGDFASATLEFADALGLGRFAVYGFHTGASIGAALAEANPERVTAVAANGLVVLREDERTTLLRDYLPPVVPRWDGGHLAWLWGRVREQAIFFPWYDRRAATRMDFDVPPADRLQLGLVEFLAAGDHYHVAYAAAFADRAERRLPSMSVPMLVTAAARDPLSGHLGRIGARSASVQVERSASAAAALEGSFNHLRGHPGDPPPASGPETLDGKSAYAGVPRQQVRVLRHPVRPRGTGPCVILLHAPGSSAAAQDGLAGEIGRHADVLNIDLPGHGASDPPAVGAEPGATLDAVVAQLAAALAPEVPTYRAILVAVGDSGPVAVELARRLGPGTPVILVEPPSRSAADTADWLQFGLSPLTPVWSGGHLLEAWHRVRDGRLFTPWFRREHAGIRTGEPDLDDRRIQQDVNDLLRANGTWQDLLRDTLLHRRRPAGSGEPRIVELPAVPSGWAEVLHRAADTGTAAS